MGGKRLRNPVALEELPFPDFLPEPASELCSNPVFRLLHPPRTRISHRFRNHYGGDELLPNRCVPRVYLAHDGQVVHGPCSGAVQHQSGLLHRRLIGGKIEAERSAHGRTRESQQAGGLHRVRREHDGPSFDSLTARKCHRVRLDRGNASLGPACAGRQARRQLTWNLLHAGRRHSGPTLGEHSEGVAEETAGGLQPTIQEHPSVEGAKERPLW